MRKAFNYKYLGRSLVDFAFIKEKLCLEKEPRGTELSRINQIVFGLRREAQEMLDMEEISINHILNFGNWETRFK